MKKIKTCLHCDKNFSTLHHVVKRTETNELGTCYKCHKEVKAELKKGYRFIV